MTIFDFCTSLERRRPVAWFVLAARLAGACLAGVCLASAGPAAANDSASELAAGGLVLVKTDAITMQREDLTLSPSEVRVRYEMRNDTGKPVTLRVAFPMPEVPSDSPAGKTTSTGGRNIAIKPPTDANFMQFRVWADQREVEPEVEIRALLHNGEDIAPGLREIGGLPLVLQPGIFLLEDKALTAETRSRLQALDAFEALDATAFRLPGPHTSPSTGCRHSHPASP